MANMENASILSWMLEYNDEKYDFYALMKVLAFLLDFEDWSELEKRASELLFQLKKTLTDIPKAYKELEKRMGIVGKGEKWSKKILNGVTRRILNAKDMEWYKDTPLDTRESSDDSAGTIIEEKRESLQNKIQDWLAERRKPETVDYTAQTSITAASKTQKKPEIVIRKSKQYKKSQKNK